MPQDEVRCSGRVTVRKTKDASGWGSLLRMSDSQDDKRTPQDEVCCSGRVTVRKTTDAPQDVVIRNSSWMKKVAVYGLIVTQDA